ncbi:ABC-ATPase domain-containing protein, partial [Staphylococcus epidermidis]|uniref:ABC-ATPase domain-containing protein n=1 Tax=Staphylococcus epidermidis TaxID=1282 RepID=UPI0028CB5BDF
LFKLRINHIQPHPFPPPSNMTLLIHPQQPKFPHSLLNSQLKQPPLTDYLTPLFHNHIQSILPQHKKLTKIQIHTSPQQILQPTPIVINNHQIEPRIQVALPPPRRTILARIARHT